MTLPSVAALYYMAKWRLGGNGGVVAAAQAGGVVVEFLQEIAGGLGNTHDRAAVVGQEDIMGWEGIGKIMI